MRKAIAVVMVASAITIGSLAPAGAAPILDQEYVAPVNDGVGEPLINQNQWLAQAFTVGLTGSLVYADAQLADVTNLPVGGLQFLLTTFAAGEPRVTLASGSVLAPEVPQFPPTGDPFQFIRLDFADVGVTAGQQLALMVRPLLGSPGAFAWAAGPNTYTGGQGYFYATSSANWFMTQSDFGFRTFVDPTAQVTPVPEPASLLLLGSGLGAAALKARRRRKQPSA